MKIADCDDRMIGRHDGMSPLRLMRVNKSDFTRFCNALANLESRVLVFRQNRLGLWFRILNGLLKEACRAFPSKIGCCQRDVARKIIRQAHDSARDIALAIRVENFCMSNALFSPETERFELSLLPPNTCIKRNSSSKAQRTSASSIVVVRGICFLRRSKLQPF